MRTGTIYADEERTIPVSPNTKTKSVTDENGVPLDDYLEKIEDVVAADMSEVKIFPTAKGKFVNFKDATVDTFYDLKLVGRVNQLTTTGKNLFCVDETMTHDEYSFDPATHRFTIGTGAPGVVQVLHYLKNPIPAGKTVSMTVWFDNGFIESGNVAVGGYHQDGSTNSWQGYVSFTVGESLRNKKLTASFVATEEVNSIVLFINAGTTITTNIVFRAQYEIGAATDYEISTGEAPAPNIDYRQEIAVPGEDGDMNLTITNKNLWTCTNTTLPDNVNYSNGVYTLTTPWSFTAHKLPEPIPAGTKCTATVKFISGNLTNVAKNVAIGGYNIDPLEGNSWQCSVELPAHTNQDMTNLVFSKTAIIEKDITDFYVFVYATTTTINSAISFTVQFEIADEASTMVNRTEKSVTIDTPNGLPGVIVESGATNIDAAGKMWRCDEIDLKNRTHTKRITKLVFDGTENWYLNNTDAAKTNRFFISNNVAIAERGGPAHGMMSNIATFAGIYSAALFDKEGDCMAYGFTHQKGWIGFAMNKTDYPDVDTFKAKLAELHAAGTPVVAYIAEQIAPEVTALTDEQISALSGLNTYAEINNMFTDSAAWIEATYQANNTLYKEQNDPIKGKDIYLSKGEAAVAAVKDALGNNIPEHYATKEEFNTAKITADTAIANAASAQTTANAAMPKSGGTFTGNVVAYSTNRTTSGLRNTEVRTTSATGTLQSTNKIIMVRK